MVTVKQVQTGIVRYVDNDLLPHLEGMKKIGLGIYMGLASENIGAAIQRYKDHPAVAMLNVVTDDGMVDIDKVYTVAKPMFDQKQSIDLPLIGRVTFDGGDVEKLYRYISEA